MDKEDYWENCRVLHNLKLLLYFYPGIIGDKSIDYILIYGPNAMIINEESWGRGNYTRTQSFKIKILIVGLKTLGT